MELVACTQCWKFTDNIETGREDVADLITLLKQENYNLHKKQTKASIAATHLESRQAESDALNQLLVMERQQQMQFIESDIRQIKLNIASLEKRHTAALESMQTYTRYIENANAWLMAHPTFELSLEHLTDKSKMINFVKNKYEATGRMFKTYKQMDNNWMYKTFPIMKPRTHDVDKQKLRDQIMKNIMMIQNICTNVPEIQHVLQHHAEFVKFIESGQVQNAVSNKMGEIQQKMAQQHRYITDAQYDQIMCGEKQTDDDTMNEYFGLT